MKKRLLATLLATTFLLASCISAILPDPPAVPDVTDAPSAAPSLGFQDGSTFVSPDFGLRFHMPEGWSVLSDYESITSLYDYESITFIYDDFMPDLAFFEGVQMPCDELPFYTIIIGDGETIRAISVTFSVIYWPYDDYANGGEYFDFEPGVEFLIGDTFMTVPYEGKTPKGRLYWYVTDSRTEGSEMLTRDFVNMHGSFMRVLSISARDREHLNEILAMFSPY